MAARRRPTPRVQDRVERGARWVWLLVPVVVVTATTVFLTTRPSPADPGPPVPPGRTITYAVVDSAGLRTTEVLDLMRPDAARMRTFAVPDGSPDGTVGGLLGGSQWTPAALLTLLPDGSAQTVQPRAPVVVPVDPRPDLPLAARTGQALRGAAGSVLGMPCTEWTTHDPLDGGPVAAAAPNQATTSCVAPDGTVLRDVLTVSGAVARTRTAVALAPLASLPVPDAAPAPPGFRVLAVEPGAPPAGSPYPGLPVAGPDGGAASATVQTATFTGDAAAPAVGESVIRTYLDAVGHLSTLEVSRDLTGAAPVDPVRGVRAVTAGAAASVLLTRAGTTFTVTATTDGSTRHLVAWLTSVR